MSRPILILGSGKTARDIGLWFHTKGFPVIWHAGSDYAASLQSFVQRIERREAAQMQEASQTSAMHVGRLGDALDGPPIAVIESRTEELAAKQYAFLNVHGKRSCCINTSHSR